MGLLHLPALKDPSIISEANCTVGIKTGTANWMDDALGKWTQRRPLQESVTQLLRTVMSFLLFSTGQYGFINIDQSLSAYSLRVIVRQRVLLKSPAGAMYQNKVEYCVKKEGKN